MNLLVDAGWLNGCRCSGTAPYDFGEAAITARGRYELQRAREAAKALKETMPKQTESQPAGSDCRRSGIGGNSATRTGRLSLWVR